MASYKPYIKKSNDGAVDELPLDATTLGGIGASVLQKEYKDNANTIQLSNLITEFSANIGSIEYSTSSIEIIPNSSWTRIRFKINKVLTIGEKYTFSVNVSRSNTISILHTNTDLYDGIIDKSGTKTYYQNQGSPSGTITTSFEAKTVDLYLAVYINGNWTNTDPCTISNLFLTEYVDQYAKDPKYLPYNASKNISNGEAEYLKFESNTYGNLWKDERVVTISAGSKWIYINHDTLALWGLIEGDVYTIRAFDCPVSAQYLPGWYTFHDKSLSFRFTSSSTIRFGADTLSEDVTFTYKVNLFRGSEVPLQYRPYCVPAILNASGDLNVFGSVNGRTSTGNRLNFRHLDGQDFNGDFGLYLQYYHPTNKIFFGNNGNYIGDNGSYYSGTSELAKKLSYLATIESSDKSNYPWHRIASIPAQKGNYFDASGTYYLQGYYVDAPYYIFRIEFRTDDISTGIHGRFGIKVLETNRSPSDLAIAAYFSKVNDNSEAYQMLIDVFVKVNNYARMVLSRLSAPDWSYIAYYNSEELYGGVRPDRDDKGEVYKDINGTTDEHASYKLHGISKYTTVYYGDGSKYGPKIINGRGTGAPLVLMGGVGNYREGLRIAASEGWSDIMLLGDDIENKYVGVSANTWSILNNNGKFYITRNGSSSGTARFSCVDNIWKVNGSLILTEDNTKRINAQSCADEVKAAGITNIDQFIQETIKKICEKYKHYTFYTFYFVESPTSSGYAEITIYNTGDTDSTGLPRYSFGQLLHYELDRMYFGTSSFKFKTYYESGQGMTFNNVPKLYNHFLTINLVKLGIEYLCRVNILSASSTAITDLTGFGNVCSDAKNIFKKQTAGTRYYYSMPAEGVQSNYETSSDTLPTFVIFRLFAYIDLSGSKILYIYYVNRSNNNSSYNFAIVDSTNAVSISFSDTVTPIYGGE